MDESFRSINHVKIEQIQKLAESGECRYVNLGTGRDLCIRCDVFEELDRLKKASEMLKQLATVNPFWCG